MLEAGISFAHRQREDGAMPETISLEPKRALTLTTEYSSPYNALIRDEIVMGVSRYFLERWVPVLGTAPAAVVNTLRQLDYRCHGEAVVISGENLAVEASMSRRHLYTCLDTPWIKAFVHTESGQRVRTESGKLNQEINRYYIRMDDPLTPADADHVLSVLINLSDNPLDAARRALALNPHQLWNTAPKHPPERFTDPRAITAYDVLRRAFPTWQATSDDQRHEFAQLAEKLHRHITLVRDDGKTAKIIVPQYFRRQWWKKLGHDLAWVYLWLRSCVYDNPDEGIRRDECWIPSLNRLLEVINRPREWWRRNVENGEAASDDWTLALFFKQLDTLKGRDPQHPQWVARKFFVALDLPIAPEDRSRYENILKNWQGEGIPSPLSPNSTGSATSKHTGQEGVCHNQTHQIAEALPHLNTPEKSPSATSEHTDTPPVCHIPTQGSATPLHRESKQKKQEILLLASKNTRKHQTNFSSVTATQSAAAAQKEKDDSHSDSLFDRITGVYETSPGTPLCETANARLWLEQVWPEPIRPHTPAWTSAISGRIMPRDLIALILSIWADASIKSPPRYLSWLIQRWQTLPEAPPVDQWPRWQALAEMSLTDWLTKGRTEWLELASPTQRALPFGLAMLAEQGEDQPDENLPPPVTLPAAVEPAAPPVPDGLDEHPGTSWLSMRDIWNMTLNHLSLQLNRSTYVEWIEGAKAVSYADGVLTVRPRRGVAREYLAQRFNYSIELSVSKLAQMPIKVQYVVDPSAPNPTNLVPKSATSTPLSLPGG
jgi:hypothetical protein